MSRPLRSFSENSTSTASARLGPLAGFFSGGKVVGISFLIELRFLKGADNLSEYNVVSHLKF